MKRNFTKILAAFALLVGLTIPMGVWGQTRDAETFTFSDLNIGDATAVETIEGDNVTLTFSQGTGTNAPKYYANGTAVRMYTNNTLQVALNEQTGTTRITAVNFTFSGSYTGSIQNWTGSETSVSFTNTSGQARIQVIAVTFSEGGTTTFTVTYDCNGGTSGCPENVTGIAANTQIQLAGAPTKTDYTFNGWSDGNTTYQAGADYTVTSNVTFTAQWTDNTTPGGDEQWVLTNLADLTTNDVFVIVGNNGSNYAMSNNKGTSSAPDAVSVTIENNQITSTVTSTIQWTGITGNATNGYTIYSNADNTKYLYCINNNNGVRVGTGNDKTFIIKDNYIYNNGQGRYLGVYNSSDWRSYTSINNNIANQTFAFYKKVTGGVLPPSITAEDVNIPYDATSGSITYTITNGVEGGAVTSAEVTASNPENWLTVNGSNPYTTPISLSCAANATATEKTATVTLTYTYNRETVTETVNVTQAANPNATMTIAEVRALSTGTTVATKGVVTSISVSGSNKTAYFQDNTAGIVAYGPFDTTVAVGDEIRVEGELTSYNGLLEIGKSNAAPTVTVLSQNNTVTPVVKTIAEISNGIQAQLVKVENATVTAIDGQNTTIAQGENTIVVRGISGVEYVVNDVLTLIANVGCYNNNPQLVNPQNVEVQHNTTPVINANNPEILAYDATSGSIAYTITNPVEGVTLQATTTAEWISNITVDESAVTFTTTANEGTADRNATITLSYTGATDKVVTVTQGHFVADYATLPFEFNGGRSDIGNTEGLTQEYLGTDYTSSPKLKFNNDNNHISTLVLKFDERPGTLSFDIKGNSFSGGTFKVQTSEDGETYSDLETYTELSDIRSEEFSNLGANVRYIKWVYTEKSSGNVALGNIKLTKPYTLDVTGYDTSTGGYVLIASPVSTTPEAAGMITDDLGAQATPETATYDLYNYDQNAEDGLEWRNYRTQVFNLEPGTGYLYANKNDVTLTFTGTAYEGDGSFDLVPGWNLVGNPFAATAYISRNFYTMNTAGSELIACTTSNDPIEAMHAVFVEGGDEDQVTFSTTAPDAKSPIVALNVTKNRGTAIDRAIVRFDEGQQLPKFQLFENSTKLYIPQGNEDYAIVRSAAQGEMPVSFRASENGTYTIAVEAENVDMNYLHLIDNMTGADVDLLATPNYTFEARTNDYTSRFRLVFSANGIDEQTAETFAFFNGTSWTVSNTGDATLQVVDITGRIVSSETINDNATVSLNQPAGIYMLRLVNGNDVKVQKVVVR